MQKIVATGKKLRVPKNRTKDVFDRRKNPRRKKNDSTENNYRKGERRNISQRAKARRSTTIPVSEDKRKGERRKIEWQDYSHDFIEKRRNWVGDITSTNLQHIGKFSFDPQQVRGNIEQMIGAAQMPLGIAGPLKVNGEFAKGLYYVPFATTEGSLIMTYHLGMQVITLSGGAKTKILKDNVHISPIFLMDNLEHCMKFKEWIQNKFLDIKKKAESTTRYGKLQSIEPRIMGNKIILIFNYTTSDAAGQNMIAIATDAACRYITNKTGYKFYLKSNFSSDKKPSMYNFMFGYGKSVFAEILIPHKIVAKILKTSSKEIFTYFKNVVMVAGTNAGMLGIHGHFANGLTGLFIACGQDVAHISNSHIGHVNYELNDNNDLYATVYLPSLLVGTVGGGTHFGTNKECLEIMGCYGRNKAKKFAETVAGVILSGEIAIISAITNGTFAQGHRKYRRK